MAMTPTKPGGWYFFIVCHNCQKEILLSEAPSQEQEKTPKVQGGKVTCPHCQSARTFEPSQVGRGWVAENRLSEPRAFFHGMINRRNQSRASFLLLMMPRPP